MTLPNFLIVGAAKCGTTSLYEYLKVHPEVFMPKRKEPNFFAGPSQGNKVSEKEYISLFSRVEREKAIGEASVAYLFAEGTPARIYEHLGPRTKILIILRNPVDAAYSLWGHKRREGGEKLEFQEAVESEPQRIRDPDFIKNCTGWLYSYAYLERARFACQVQNYISQFGSEQVKVLIFEEFFSDPVKWYSEVCRFLGVSDDYQPSFQVHNSTGSVKSTWLRDIAIERRAWKEPLKLVIPRSARRWMQNKVYWWNRKRSLDNTPIPLQIRKKVWKLLEEDVTELERILDRSVKDIWRVEGSRLRENKMESQRQ